MRVGIHPGRYREIPDFIKKYEIILKFNDIECEYLHADDPDFFEKVKSLDAFIYRWYHYDYDRQLATTILPLIRDFLKIKCFPDNATDWHFDDKIKQYYLLKLYNFPVCESWIFWDRKDALEWTDTARYPLIFKLKGGAGSKNVLLVRNSRKAKQLVRRMFGRGFSDLGILNSMSTSRHDFRLLRNLKILLWQIKRSVTGRPAETVYQKNRNYVLFQEFLSGNKFDTRITVIGNRAFGFRRFNRKNDFRSSGSGIIDHDPAFIDTGCVRIAFEISRKFAFQSMAYDFLCDESGQIKFSEISYSFLDTTVHQCTGYWDKDLNWHEGHFWPQFCQLQDLLNMPELKQPVIS
ncbi:MAG TPA: hypothetical protein VMT63_00050 [Bacteroidales bacterium]|nr:hypothetical protein [Bacteroidales bacterium]